MSQPAAAGGVYDEFLKISEASSIGTVAFLATVVGGSDGVFTYGIPGVGPAVTAVLVGDTTPIRGTTYASFKLGPQANAGGEVLFHTKLSSVISFEAVFLWGGITSRPSSSRAIYRWKPVARTASSATSASRTAPRFS